MPSNPAVSAKQACSTCSWIIAWSPSAEAAWPSVSQPNCIALDSREDVGPLLEHLGVAVADADREVRVAGLAERAQALLQLGLRRRHRQRADQVGRADLPLLRAQDHEMA